MAEIANVWLTDDKVDRFIQSAHENWYTVVTQWENACSIRFHFHNLITKGGYNHAVISSL
jgi:hypothetical protein